MAGHDDSDDIQWIEGIATQHGIVEKICPKRHVRQNEWMSEWNDMYGDGPRYDYISDYESIFRYPMNHIAIRKDLMENLKESKREGTSVPITNLVHFTNPHCAAMIVEENGFRGGAKKINEDQLGNDVTARFSWWSPIFTTQDKNNVRNHLGEVIKPFIRENDNLANVKNQFATSDAFEATSWRYGGHFFKYNINELLGYYGDYVKDELEYKILGTFGYKKQVMHAVLVCSKANGAEQFAAYPNVLSPAAEDGNNEAVITRDADGPDDDGNWIWKPQATGGDGIIRLQAQLQSYPMYRRWENVAFAFHLPDDAEGVWLCGEPIDHLD